MYQQLLNRRFNPLSLFHSSISLKNVLQQPDLSRGKSIEEKGVNMESGKLLHLQFLLQHEKGLL